jgi:hypothetical protein
MYNVQQKSICSAVAKWTTLYQKLSLDIVDTTTGTMV